MIAPKLRMMSLRSILLYDLYFRVVQYNHLMVENQKRATRRRIALLRSGAYRTRTDHLNTASVTL